MMDGFLAGNGMLLCNKAIVLLLFSFILGPFRSSLPETRHHGNFVMKANNKPQLFTNMNVAAW